MFRHMLCFGLIAVPHLLGQPVLFQCTGAAVTVAEGINNSGTVVGYYYLTQGGGSHAFVYSSGACTTIDVQGATSTVAMAINDSGTISGYYIVTNSDGSKSFHGFLRSAGGAITVLDYPTTTSNTIGLDINSAGTNVILDLLNGSPVFLHSGTTYTPVTFSHPVSNSKMGINDSLNVIVGTVGTSQNPGCFIDSYPSGTSTAFAVPGATMTLCNDINNAGTIAGSYFTSQGEFAFVRVGSTVTTLQGLQGASANGLNDMGQVVGYYATSGSGTASFITNISGSFVRGDFDGNGVPDLVIQNDTSRQIAIYYMGGAGGASIINFGWIRADGIPGWTVSTVADLNGDGVPDVIIQNDTTRQVAVYYMGGAGGASITGFAWIRADGIPGWTVKGAADFNGDGVPDLIIQNDSTRQIAVYFMGGAGGASITGFAWIRADGIPGWSVKGAADFNGDGVPDIIIQNDTTRQIAVYFMGGAGGASITGFAWIRADGIPGWSVVGVADLDSDGVPDVIIQNDSTRQIAVYFMGGAGGASITGFAWIRADGIPGWTALSAR